jgi:hypothetical protein
MHFKHIYRVNTTCKQFFDGYLRDLRSWADLGSHSASVCRSISNQLVGHCRKLASLEVDFSKLGDLSQDVLELILPQIRHIHFCNVAVWADSVFEAALGQLDPNRLQSLCISTPTVTFYQISPNKDGVHLFREVADGTESAKFASLNRILFQGFPALKTFVLNVNSIWNAGYLLETLIQCSRELSEIEINASVEVSDPYLLECFLRLKQGAKNPIRRFVVGREEPHRKLFAAAGIVSYALCGASGVSNAADRIQRFRIVYGDGSQALRIHGCNVASALALHLCHTDGLELSVSDLNEIFHPHQDRLLGDIAWVLRKGKLLWDQQGAELVMQLLGHQLHQPFIRQNELLICMDIALQAVSATVFAPALQQQMLNLAFTFVILAPKWAILCGHMEAISILQQHVSSLDPEAVDASIFLRSESSVFQLLQQTDEVVLGILKRCRTDPFDIRNPLDPSFRPCRTALLQWLANSNPGVAVVAHIFSLAAHDLSKRDALKNILDRLCQGRSQIQQKAVPAPPALLALINAAAEARLLRPFLTILPKTTWDDVEFWKGMSWVATKLGESSSPQSHLQELNRCMWKIVCTAANSIKELDLKMNLLMEIFKAPPAFIASSILRGESLSFKTKIRKNSVMTLLQRLL